MFEFHIQFLQIVKRKGDYYERENFINYREKQQN